MRALLFLLVFATTAVKAQSTRELRSFFSEPSVQNLFYYAHPNASEFKGLVIKEVTRERVIVRASFEPGFLGSLLGGSYTCTICIYVDGNRHFTNITTRCDSNASSRWPCFRWATEELRDKCRSASRSSRSISFMEDYYDKRLNYFTGEEAMCTLLTIALYNYDD